MWCRLYRVYGPHQYPGISGMPGKVPFEIHVYDGFAASKILGHVGYVPPRITRVRWVCVAKYPHGGGYTPVYRITVRTLPCDLAI